MIFLIFMYFVIGIFYLLFAYKKYFISPNIIFIATQMVMMLGMLSYFDYSNTADKELILIYFIAQIMFIFGTEFAYMLRPVTYRRAKFSDNDSLSDFQKQIIWIMVAVSIMACTYLFVSSGSNIFLLIIKSIMSKTTNNYTDSRIAINNISGVGYIYQFRVIILPLLIAYLATVSKGMEKKITLMIFPVMVIFVLGTGQRGGFVMFVLIWLVSLLVINRLYKMSMNKTIFKIVIFSLSLFTIMTLYNGRAEMTGSLTSAMVARFLGDNQETAVVGFRYIVTQPTQWGLDWLYSIADILPGKSSYLQLSYIIFEIMYGSTRGTAPPSIWGSVYYNWSIIGVLIIPVVMGMVYYNFYYRLYAKSITKLRIFLYSAMFVILGMWIADTPMVLFNQGFITVCLLAIFLRVDKAIGSKTNL